MKFSPVSLIALSACLALACSGAMRQDNALIDRLKNRGPVTLSSDNPFLAANLLLSREMASSPELSGFVQHRGTPAGMAVEKQIFGSLTLHFYYLDRSEHYTLEQTEGLWIISAPQPLRPDEERTLRQVGSSAAAVTKSQTPYSNTAALLTPTTEPTKLVVASSPTPSAHPPSAPTELIIASVSASSTASPIPAKPGETALSERGFKSLPQAATPAGIEITPLPKRAEITPISTRPALRTLSTQLPAPSKVAMSATPEKSIESPTQIKPSADSAIVESIRTKVSTEQAEVTPRGDLVHYITSEGENLDLITLWYTLDRTNAGRVARVNNLGERSRLNIGDTVVIPAYLLRNKTRLSVAAFTALKQTLPTLDQAAQGQTSAAVTPKSLGSEAAQEREKHK